MTEYTLNDTTKNWKITASSILSSQDLDISSIGNIRLTSSGAVTLNGSYYPGVQYNARLDIGDSDYTLTNTYLNSYLPIVSSSERTITFPLASNYTGSSFEIENANTNGANFVLSCGTIFSGAWGSDLSNMFLPPNSSIKLYSDGVNWVAYSAGETGWTKGLGYSTNNQFSPDVNQWYNNYSGVTTVNCNLTLTVPPKSKWEGLNCTFVYAYSGTPYYNSTATYDASSQNIIVSPVYITGSQYGVITGGNNPVSMGTSRTPIVSVLKTSELYTRTSTGNVNCINNKRTINITTFSTSMGTISLNSTINISGTIYTIISVGRCTGGTATRTTDDQITVVTRSGNEKVLNAGTPLTFTDSSSSELTVLDLSGSASNNIWKVPTNSVSNFTNLAFTAPTGIGNTGTYGLNMPFSGASGTYSFTLDKEAYNWVLAVNP